MKLFCSNAFTGEDFEIVAERMQKVVDTLNGAGHDAYCPVFDPHKVELQESGDKKSIFEYAFKNLKKCDGMVAIITSERKSEGQLMEIGASLSMGKPLYLFLHSTTSASPTHLKVLADKVFIWSTDDELVQVLKGL